MHLMSAIKYAISNGMMVEFYSNDGCLVITVVHEKNKYVNRRFDIDIVDSLNVDIVIGSAVNDLVEMIKQCKQC